MNFLKINLNKFRAVYTVSMEIVLLLKARYFTSHCCEYRPLLCDRLDFIIIVHKRNLSLFRGVQDTANHIIQTCYLICIQAAKRLV